MHSAHLYVWLILSTCLFNIFLFVLHKNISRKLRISKRKICSDYTFVPSSKSSGGVGFSGSGLLRNSSSSAKVSASTLPRPFSMSYSLSWHKTRPKIIKVNYFKIHHMIFQRFKLTLTAALNCELYLEELRKIIRQKIYPQPPLNSD